MTIINPDLTLERRRILFEKATEAPFSGELLSVDGEGTFHCANCQAPLFATDHKYDSGSGWPSFDQAIDRALEFTRDDSMSMQRVEVNCARCGSHLGHVFDDGPPETTGKRYCINSLSMTFDASEETPAD